MRNSIGIGVTHTSNRPEHLKLFISQIEKHTKQPYKLHITTDIMNIAKAKNDCLWNLKDCDHIFLFDDDCFPIKNNWENYFINSEIKHSLYLTERHVKLCLGIINRYDVYKDCGGCFMYISKDAFNKVGYFNSEYKQYGFEHAGWSKRFNNEKYISLPLTNEYLYSLDYQGEGNWGVKHKPSMTDYKAIQESIDYNRKVFEKEINSDKIYYDYTP